MVASSDMAAGNRDPMDSSPTSETRTALSVTACSPLPRRPRTGWTATRGGPQQAPMKTGTGLLVSQNPADQVCCTSLGALTQLVECHLCKVEVRGSSPLCSTKS